MSVEFSFEELRHLYDKFRKHDRDNNQIISRDELLKLVQEEVSNATEREVEWFLQMVDIKVHNKNAIRLTFPQYVRGIAEFSKVGSTIVYPSGGIAKTLADSGLLNFGLSLTGATKKKTLDWRDVDRIYSQFLEGDANNSGAITYSEMNDVLKKLLPELPESQYCETFNKVDTNKSGFIDFMEFLHWITENQISISLGRSKGKSKGSGVESSKPRRKLQREKSKKSMQVVKLRSRSYSLARDQQPVVVDKILRAEAFKAFAAMDANADGELSEEEFLNALTMMLGDIGKSTTNRLYHVVDSDCSGSISYEEFLYAVANETEVRKLASRMQHNYYPSKFEWEIPYDELEIGPKIGEGNFGVVYKGKWNGTPVAIKELKQQTLSDEIMKDFKQEVAMLAKLRHPNVVLFMGACTQPNNMCIITEYLPEGSVFNALHKRTPSIKLTTKDVVKLAIQTARGVNYLHNKNIIHRDLKSLNLLIDDNRVCKICDFGLSSLQPTQKDTKQKEKLTEQVGSPLWMAPELLANKPYGEKIDVYSFAVCVWECLTGSLPYKDFTYNELVVAIVDKGKRPDIPNSCPKQLADLLRWCWETSPDKRPSFTEVIEALEAIKL